MPEEKYIQDPGEIRLNSRDEIQQILGRPPNWLLHWGISLIFLAVVVFIGLAWFISYPDIVSAEAMLTTENPPIRLVAFSRGKIEKLLVENNQQVDENTLLAILENPASYEDVETLERELLAIAGDDLAVFLKLKLPESLSLGTLQNNYAGLLQKLKDLQYYFANNIAIEKKIALEAQIKQTKALNGLLQKQEATMKEEVELYKKNWIRDKDLFAKGSVSEKEMETSETVYLQQKRQVESISANIVNNNIKIEQLKVQILELGQDKNDTYSIKMLAIGKDISSLKTAIENWKQNYLIITPVAGKVSMAKVWSPNQFVNANEEVMTIVPQTNTGKIICKAALLPEGAGKVAAGMVVNLELNGFPFQEFGVIKGVVSSIALVPDEDRYITEITLPDTLISTYNKVIPFRQEMKATAQIISEDRTIFDRVFDKILDVVYNK